MKSNKTIINGIDVSKCVCVDTENFEKPICHCITQRNECERPCEDKKDCYFKQLARAREEIEKFKDKVKYMEEYIKTVETARNEIEQEYEKYKQILDSLEQFFKENKQTIEIAKDIVIKYAKQYFKEKIEKENFDFFHKAEEQ